MIPALHHVCGNSPAELLRSVGIAVPTGTEALFLHASSVVMDGRAVLFLGHSTAGKSTISRLLRPLCPFVADDTVLAWRDAQGTWQIIDGKIRFTSPFPGSRAPDEPLPGPVIPHPLKGCLRIHKGTSIRLAPLHPVHTARYLMDAAMEVDVQRKLGRLDPKEAAQARGGIAEARAGRVYWFRLVAEIARTDPGHHLWFPLAPDTARLQAAIAEALAPPPSPSRLDP